MTEFYPNNDPQPSVEEMYEQLTPEVQGLVPEIARLALIEEVKSGAVCTGFGDSRSDLTLRKNALRVWQAATGSDDRAQFTADLDTVSSIIAAQGGAETVRDTYLSQRDADNSAQ